MTDAIDIIGGHNATIEGVVDVQVGQVGNKFVGDGATVLTVPKHADFDQGRFTIMGWVDTVSATLQTIIANWQDVDGVFSGFHVDITAAGKLDFHVAKNSGNVKGTDYENVESPLAISDGEQTFIAVRYDGKTIDLFVSGLMVATAPWASGVVYDANCTTSLLALGTVAIGPADFVAHYPLESADISGGILSGYGVDAVDLTVSASSPTLDASGQIGEARAFSGTAQHFSTIDTITLASGLRTTSYARSCWVKTTDNANDYRTLIMEQDKVGGAGPNYGIQSFLRYGRVNVLHGGNTMQAPADKLVNDGLWHHVCYTGDATNGAKLYIDGLEVITAPSHFAVWNPSENMSFVIGNGSTDTAANWREFLGSIDDVKCFARELSAPEVLSLYLADGGS